MRVRAPWRAGLALDAEWSRGGGRGTGPTMTRLKAAGKHGCFGVLEAPHTRRCFFFLLRLLPALQNFPLHNSDMPEAAKGELYIYFNQRLNCCRFSIKKTDI